MASNMSLEGTTGEPATFDRLAPFRGARAACVRCGYDRTGLPPSMCCPECGGQPLPIQGFADPIGAGIPLARYVFALDSEKKNADL